jgi:hypothetical protein
LLSLSEDLNSFSAGKQGGGRNVVKRSFILLPVVLGSALAGAQVLRQISGAPGSDLKTPYVGSALTCSLPSTIVVPRPLLERAKLKARLLTLLHDSLYEDARGVVNIEREKEIRKLANKLKSDREDY